MKTKETYLEQGGRPQVQMMKTHGKWKINATLFWKLYAILLQIPNYSSWPMLYWMVIPKLRRCMLASVSVLQPFKTPTGYSSPTWDISWVLSQKKFFSLRLGVKVKDFYFYLSFKIKEINYKNMHLEYKKRLIFLHQHQHPIFSCS